MAALSLVSCRAVALQPHSRCVSVDLSFKVYGGKFMDPLFRRSDLRKWRKVVENRDKQFRREMVQQRYEHIVENRVVTRIPHLQAVHKQRMLNFVQLENARVAAYRKFEMIHKMQELNAQLEETEAEKLREREATDSERRERIAHFEGERFLSLDDIDQAVDDALDNPIGFGSPLTRQGHKLVRQTEERTTTTSVEDGEDGDGYGDEDDEEDAEDNER